METKKSVIFLFGVLILSILANPIKANGELETSKPQNMSIFVLPAIPIIQIISPENKTYSSAEILLNYSIKNTIDSIWYNLDNTRNITIDSPLQFTTTERSHTLYLYANNTYGTSVKSVSFMVSKKEPPTPPGEGNDGGSGGGKQEEPSKEKNETKDTGIEPATENPISDKKTEETTKEYLYILIIIALIILIISLMAIKSKKLEKHFKKIMTLLVKLLS